MLYRQQKVKEQQELKQIKELKMQEEKEEKAAQAKQLIKTFRYIKPCNNFKSAVHFVQTSNCIGLYILYYKI